MSFDPIHEPLPSGFLAIEASAGTGKTWTLSHLVARLLLTEPGLALRQVLVVTFTNAAADELAERIRRVLAACRSGGDAVAGELMRQAAVACGGEQAARRRLDACLSGLDELAVGTIHAACRRILERAAFACGESFTAELLPDDGELVAGAVRDCWRARLWDDERLARHARNWSVDGDVRAWRRWHRHPGTRIEPAIDLDAALAAVDTAADAVRTAATPPAIATLRGWGWKSEVDEQPALDLLAAGADPRDGIDALAVLADPAANVYKKHHRDALGHPLCQACAALLDAVAQVRVAWLGWLCPAVATRLADRCAANGQWTQDDLLRRVRQALDARPELAATVRGLWPIALIDEFQDTDPVQWGIFRRCWGEGGRLVVVGDPKQAVYRFRGADLDVYLDAIAGREPRRLAVNHRSEPALVRAVQTLIRRTAAPFLDPRILLPPVEGRPDPARPALDGWDAPLTVLLPPSSGPATRHEAVATELVMLLTTTRYGDRRLLPQDCAVLVRTRAQAADLQAELQARGIPASIAVDGDVLDSEAAADLRLVLTALSRPRDAIALRLALATRAWGRDAATIAALVADDAAWQQQVEQVEAWHQRWLRHGLAAAVESWDAAVGASARLAALADGERRLTDWRHAVEVLHTRAAAGLRPAALLSWWDRRDPADAEQRRLRLEGDASAVRILTMHVAKGLEFPVVFCPYLGHRDERPDEGALCVDAAGPRLVLGGPGLATAEAAAAAEDDAEQLRLAYVALTRARSRCYVLWGRWERSLSSLLRSALGWWLRPDGMAHPAWRAATASGLSGRDGLLAGMVQAVAGLQGGDDGIGMREALADNRRWQPASAAVAGDGLRSLHAAVRARLDAPRQVTSFTGLLGGGDSAPERRQGDEPQLPAAAAGLPPTGLRALARGADVGDALHRLLEEWNFQADPLPLAERALARAGLAEPGPRQPHAVAPAAAVATALRALAALPIGGSLQLGAVPDRLRRAEWEFHLPLARVRPARVLALIGKYAAAPPAVLAQLPRLREAAPAGGFLKGYVDLLACVDEAWWVLDWKSNHLGDRPEDYAEERLWPAMAEHGYLVQALLYVLGLHRFLQHRLGADYDYRRHVAGAAWVFLRGVEEGQGVWTWKPPLALVRGLESELLEARP